MIYLQETNFYYNGLPLSQAYDDVIERDLNGIYKLIFKLPVNESDQHKLVEKDSMLKATEHFREIGYNIFRVRYIDKEEDYVQFTAYQIIFDLAKKYVNPFFVNDLLPVDALKMWSQKFNEPPNLSIEYWSDTTDKRVTYYSNKQDDLKPRYALNVLVEMANQSDLDLDFYLNGISLGRIGRDTQFLYTTNKNITSFGQEDNYDEVITRIIATSKFKPEYDKKKLKKKQKEEVEALKTKQAEFNKRLADEKRQNRIEKEIKEAIRLEGLKKIRYKEQKKRSYKTMQVRVFKSSDEIENEIREKYKAQQQKTDIQRQLAKEHAEKQKAEIAKLKEKHKEETELLNEEITLSVTVDSPLINEYPEVYEMSIENNDIKTVEELTTFAENYFSVQNIDKPNVSTKIGLEVLQNEEVHLGDTVIVRHIEQDIDVRNRVIATNYSPMDKKYLEVTFGSKTSNYATQNSNLSNSNTEMVIRDYQSQLEQYLDFRLNTERENFNNHFEQETGLIRDKINESNQTSQASINVLDNKFTEEFNNVQNEFRTSLQNAQNQININQASYTSDKEVVQSKLTELYSKQNESKLYIDTKANDVTNEFNQSIEKAKSEVLQATNFSNSATLEQINQINRKVDNMKIGAVNLLKGTSNYTTPFNHNKIVEFGKVINDQLYALEHEDSKGYFFWETNQFVKLEPNTDYVLSYDVIPKFEVGGAYTPIEIVNENGYSLKPRQFLFKNETIKEVRDKQRLTFKFNTGNQTNLRIYFTSTWPNKLVYIAKPQLEKGTVASDWSPNVDDLEKQINVVADSISSRAIEAVRGDINYLRSNILTADSVNANMVNVDRALIDKLMTNNLLVNNLTSNYTLTEKMKSKALESVYGNISNLRTRLITANSITSNAINVDYGLVNKLISNETFVNTLTAKSAFINAIKAIDIDASRITSGVLRSTSGSMRWNLNANSLDYFDGAETNYYGHSRIIFHTTNNSIYQSNNGTCAFLHFNRTKGTQYPAIAVGTSGNLDDNSNTGSFSGIKCHTAKATDDGLSQVGIITDKVYFNSHGGDVNTGGWTIENYRKGGNTLRAFYGNNTREYKYELGQDGYRFNTVWTSGLNDRIKIVNYTDGYAGILSNNEKYGIQFSNYDVRVKYGKYWYSFGDILRGDSWRV